MQNRLTHTRYVLLALVLPLTYIYVRHHLPPTRLRRQLLILLTQLLLSLDIFPSPFLLLLLLLDQKLVELPPTLLLALPLQIILLLLCYNSRTLFYRSTF